MNGTVWERVGGLAIVEHEDSTLILNLPQLLEAQQPLLLAGPAHIVWSLIDGKRTHADIVAAVSEMYGVEPAEVEPDIAAFLEDAQTQGLARRRSSREGQNTSSMKRPA